MKKIKPLIISGFISVGLLITFSIMHICDCKILTIDSKWLFVSGVPLLVGLFLSGLIKKFKGFGVELEAGLSEKIEVGLVSDVESYKTPDLDKGSLNYLENMSSNEKKDIKRLKFVLGRKDYYVAFIIRKYFEELRNIEYIEFVDNEGRFKSLLPAHRYIRIPSSRLTEEETEKIINDKIRNLIGLIENGFVPNKYKYAISDSVNKSDSLTEAFTKFKFSPQGMSHKGDQILPVLDNKDMMIGLTKKSQIAEEISEQVIKFI